MAGTSRIEGAEFTEKELEAALRQTPEQLETHSQRQAAAGVATYRWIARLPGDQPLDETLIREVHRRLVTGCDDDHCPPGQLRGRDENVTTGTQRHRGVEGGDECGDAPLSRWQWPHRPCDRGADAAASRPARHPLHRHVELLLRGEPAYLQALNDTRANDHDLTPFLRFALKGVEAQCRRLFGEIRLQVAKALYRNTVTDLFGRLKSPRKRVMSARHVQLLNLLLDAEEIPLAKLGKRTVHFYTLKNPNKALIRDLNYLIGLRAISARRLPDNSDYLLSINLDWPTKITETEFFRHVREMPKGKVYSFLST